MNTVLYTLWKSLCRGSLSAQPTPFCALEWVPFCRIQHSQLPQLSGVALVVVCRAENGVKKVTLKTSCTCTAHRHASWQPWCSLSKLNRGTDQGTKVSDLCFCLSLSSVTIRLCSKGCYTSAILRNMASCLLPEVAVRVARL